MRAPKTSIKSTCTCAARCRTRPGVGLSSQLQALGPKKQGKWGWVPFIVVLRRVWSADTCRVRGYCILRTERMGPRRRAQGKFARYTFRKGKMRAPGPLVWSSGGNVKKTKVGRPDGPLDLPSESTNHATFFDWSREYNNNGDRGTLFSRQFSCPHSGSDAKTALCK